MRRMIAAAALFLLFAAGPAPAQTPPADALVAARELIVTMKATDQFKALFPLLMQNLKPAIVQNRPAVERDFDAVVPLMLEAANARIGEMVDAMAQVYANTFRAAEIRDMTAFFKTSTGQKYVEKTTVLAQQSMMAGQAWGRSVATEIQDKIVNELRKRGHNI